MNDKKNLSKKNASQKGNNKDFFNLLNNNLLNKKNNPPPNNRDNNKNEKKKEQNINEKDKILYEHFNNNKIQEVKSPHFFQEKGGKQEDNKFEKIEPLNNSNCSSLKNLFGGIKQSPNITEINKVMMKSQDILKEQKIILETFSQVNQKLTASDNEIQNFNNKNENDDISNFMGKYSDCMKLLVEKLKGHAEEVEKIKCNNKNIFSN